MTAQAEGQERFDQWCIVELMGHQRMAGKVQEVTIAGAALLRLDVPETPKRAAYTRYLSPSALYALNPTTEAMARAAAIAFQPEPVKAWELDMPKALPPAPEGAPLYEHDDEDDDEDDRPY